jgi:hypothetical protein
MKSVDAVTVEQLAGCPSSSRPLNPGLDPQVPAELDCPSGEYWYGLESSGPGLILLGGLAFFLPHFHFPALDPVSFVSPGRPFSGRRLGFDQPRGQQEMRTGTQKVSGMGFRVGLHQSVLFLRPAAIFFSGPRG